MTAPSNAESPRLRRLPHPGGWAWVLDRAPLDTLTADLESFAANTGASAMLVSHGELELPADLLAEDEALSALAAAAQASTIWCTPSQNPTLHTLITDALGIDPTCQRSDADLAEWVRGLLRELQGLRE